jgi:beta-lactamase class A
LFQKYVIMLFLECNWIRIQTVKSKTLKIILYTLLVFVVGFYFGQHTSKPNSIGSLVRDSSNTYPLINPLLGAEIGDKDLFSEYKPLESSVAEYVNSAKKEGNASAVSVYFRDLNSGKWTGVNENDTYAPASMLKVVVMLAYLDKAEDNPATLSKSLLYSDTDNSNEFFASNEKLTNGYHPVSQLLNSMIIDSDNDALDALIKNDTGQIEVVNKSLRLPLPVVDSGASDYMSARVYSRIFRVLYSSTFLSRSVSNHALELLTETKFDKGIVAGVPKGMKVAHKFGERTVLGAGNKPTEKELHDCGIIYDKENPYLLCVMTKGTDFNKLASVISDVSRLVYQDVVKK